MHRLRRVLQRLRRRRMEPGLSRPGGAQPRLDPGQGRARRGKARAPARGRRRCRLPCLPHAHELHRALPDAPLSHRGDLGPQESSSGFGSEGRAVSAKAQTLLWIAQRASAALLALCVIVHLVTIIYAVQGGLSAAEIFGRTRGNVAWFMFTRSLSWESRSMRRSACGAFSSNGSAGVASHAMGCFWFFLWLCLAWVWEPCS